MPIGDKRDITWRASTGILFLILHGEAACSSHDRVSLTASNLDRGPVPKLSVVTPWPPRKVRS